MSATEAVETLEPPRIGPRGIEGWLVLVCLGVILAPLRILFVLLFTFAPLFLSGAWLPLVQPSSDSFHPLWGPLLAYELFGNTALLAARVALLLLFFKRSKRFPKLFVWVSLLELPFLLVDAWLGSIVIEDEPMFDPETLRALAGSVAAVAIWVPYMLVSKRVRNTFVV